jgi:hypothetical protein
MRLENRERTTMCSKLGVDKQMRLLSVNMKVRFAFPHQQHGMEMALRHAYFMCALSKLINFPPQFSKSVYQMFRQYFMILDSFCGNKIFALENFN